MLHYGLIGERLGHSLSVPIHRAVYAYLGIQAEYRLFELPRAEFAARAQALMGELDGFNVTIPYKLEIMPLLASVAPAARSLGAVNTVALPSRVGYNTDAPGFAAMLRRAGIDPAGRACFVLGTGGASRAVSAALRGLGAEGVTLVSRHPQGAEISYADLPAVFSGVLVNTTPVGTWPAVDDCPLAPAALAAVLARAVGVADVVYNPPETALVRAARAAGVRACAGLYMLVAQALCAEEIWQGRDLPADLADDIMKELTRG